MKTTPHVLACAVAAALAVFSLPQAQAEPGGVEVASADASDEQASASDSSSGDAAGELETVEIKLSIVGLGETRQVQTMDAAEAERYPSGTSLLKLLDRLPGVHFTNSDPFGTYGWAKRLSIRGFTQNQLGFTLDRMPLGDQSYGNHNGLHVDRALIAENLGQLELAQGGGSLDTASSGNLGGAVRITSAEPDYDFNVRLEQTFGSDNDHRTFARMDTGELHGWRSYVSAVNQESEKWKGWGQQRVNQVNAKTTREIGPTVLTAYFAGSRRMETDYADLSLVSTQQRGFDWDNYAPDWQAAIDAAFDLCGAGGGAYFNECDDAYYLGRGLRDDNLGYITLDWNITGSAALITTVYKHTNEGQGHWANPYPPAAAQTPGFPIALRTSEYTIDRWGVLPTLTLFLGDHKVETGFWYEHNDNNFFRNFYPLTADTPPDRGAFVENPIVRDFGGLFEVETLQFFVQDRISLMDSRLTVDVGFKGIDVDYDATALRDTRRNDQFVDGKINAKDSFLPKAAVRYGFTPTFEGFLAYGENISVYRTGVGSVFNTTQAGFDAIKDVLKPETSRTIEGGVRLVNDTFEGSLTIYDVLFEDRLFRITPCTGIGSCPASLANVGSVDTEGVELAGLWRVTDSIEWYNSIAHNSSKYADDYDANGVNPGGEVLTGGKDVVDSPEWLVSSNLGWISGNWELKLGAKYTSQRYFTYLNDGEVDGYTIVNVGLIYRLNDLAWANYGRIQFNITNLLDKEHHQTIGTNGFFNSYDPSGYAATLQSGAPRQFFVTAAFNF